MASHVRAGTASRRHIIRIGADGRVIIGAVSVGEGDPSVQCQRAATVVEPGTARCLVRDLIFEGIGKEIERRWKAVDVEFAVGIATRSSKSETVVEPHTAAPADVPLTKSIGLCA